MNECQCIRIVPSTLEGVYLWYVCPKFRCICLWHSSLQSRMPEIRGKTTLYYSASKHVKIPWKCRPALIAFKPRENWKGGTWTSPFWKGTASLKNFFSGGSSPWFSIVQGCISAAQFAITLLKTNRFLRIQIVYWIPKLQSTSRFFPPRF